MSKYEVMQRVNHGTKGANGKIVETLYDAGASAEFDDATAGPLISVGAIKLIGPAKKAKADKAPGNDTASGA